VNEYDLSTDQGLKDLALTLLTTAVATMSLRRGDSEVVVSEGDTQILFERTLACVRTGCTDAEMDAAFEEGARRAEEEKTE
jgi:hypothetical protein